MLFAKSYGFRFLIQFEHEKILVFYIFVLNPEVADYFFLSISSKLPTSLEFML